MVKFTTEVFDVGGRKVEITRVPPRMRKSSYLGKPILKPQEQALFEVRIAGEFVARAVRPFRVGKQAYLIERLGDNTYLANIGYQVVFGEGYLPPEDRLFTLDRVAEKAVRLRDEIFHDISRLPTEEELATYLELNAKRNAEEKVASKAREAQRKIDRARERAEEDAAFHEVIEGLKSIDERLGTQLNNFEINALRIAIAKYEKDRERIIAHRDAFEDDAFKGR